MKKTKTSNFLKIEWYFYALLVILALSECDNSLDTDKAEDTSVQFTTEFGTTITRATTLDNVWTADEDSIAISDETDVYEYRPKQTTSSNDPDVKLVAISNDKKFFWPVDATPKTFSAWCSHGTFSATLYDSGTTNKTIEVSANQSSISDRAFYAYDFMYAPPVPVSYKDPVHFTFYHQLALVIVSVDAMLTQDPENNNETETVQSVQFGQENICISRQITQLGTTGSTATEPLTAWDNSYEHSSSIIMRQTGRDPENARYTYECILPKQSGGDTSTPLLTIVTNKHKYIYKNAFDLESGYLYVYNISISKIGNIAVTLATVADWGLSGTYSGDADIPDASYPD